MDKNQKLIEIFQNEQFKAECQNLNTAEDLKELFAKYDLDLSMDEVYALCAQIASSSQSGELDENDLDAVAGGFAWVAVAAIGLGVACVGSFAVGVYNGYKEATKG